MSRSLRRARAAFLARLLRSEQRMREAYVRAAVRIRRALTARPDATQAEIERVVLRELVRTTRQRLGIIERSTSDSARRGRIAQIAETAEALGRDDLGVRVTAQGPWTDTSRRQLNVAAASADGLTLPQRLRGLDRRTAEAIARELTAAREAAEGAKVAARRLERVAGVELQQAVPRYVRDLAEAVRQAPSGSEVKRIVKAARERVLRRGSVAGSDFTIRGANRKLLADLAKPGVDVDRVVAEWVERKATYRARMIARTEGQRAFARAYVETAQANPRVEALKWNLNPSHPRPDVCDHFAAMDPAGLGEGVYPKDGLPDMPAHPHCFPAGTMIETSAGRVPIESVGVGTMVLTHRARFMPVERLSERLHAGDIVEALIGDQLLIATPEHPVLTARGWVRIEDLAEGDIAYRFSHANNREAERRRVGILGGVAGNLLWRGVPVPGVAFDEQPAIGEPDVEVELEDSHLRDRPLAHRTQHVEDPSLVSRQASARLDRAASSQVVFDRDRLSTSPFMGEPGKPQTLVRRPLRGKSALRFAGGDWLKTSSHDRLAHEPTRATDAPRHLIFGHPRCVHGAHPGHGDIFELHSVHVRSVSRRAFRGRVFNFAVRGDESYVATAIVVHNCMCFPSSVLVRPDGSSSITRTEPRAPHETLAAMPAERRREILGPGRARLFERAPTAVVRPDGTFRTLAGAERLAARRRRRAASSV